MECTFGVNLLQGPRYVNLSRGRNILDPNGKFIDGLGVEVLNMYDFINETVGLAGRGLLILFGGLLVHVDNLNLEERSMITIL